MRPHLGLPPIQEGLHTVKDWMDQRSKRGRSSSIQKSCFFILYIYIYIYTWELYELLDWICFILPLPVVPSQETGTGMRGGARGTCSDSQDWTMIAGVHQHGCAPRPTPPRLAKQTPKEESEEKGRESVDGGEQLFSLEHHFTTAMENHDVMMMVMMVRHLSSVF